MRRVMRYAFITSSITVAVMLGFWWWLVPHLFSPAPDTYGLGIPLILYHPKLSLIGWYVLMVGIAPLLQFVVMLASAMVTFLFRLRKGWGVFPE
jgi:hypothetical protein